MGSLLRFYNKASWAFLIGVGLLLVSVATYYVDIKPPRFREALVESITNNLALMEQIGGWRERQFQYSDSTEQANTFKVIVTGKCDSAEVVIRGTYTGNAYSVTDTTVKACR